jgi:hypothetical protein
MAIQVLISGYVGGGYGRSLGVRRTGGRQPLHDPEAEGALVLFCPRELSEHEKLKVGRKEREIVKHSIRNTRSDGEIQELSRRGKERDIEKPLVYNRSRSRYCYLYVCVPPVR